MEQAQTRPHRLHFTPQGAGPGTRIQLLTSRQYCLFRLFCIFRHIACGAALGTNEGTFHAPEACAAGRKATPHQNKERAGRTRKGDASEFRAQLDELSPGLLKSPFSRWLLEPPSGEGGEGGEDSLLSS